MNKTCLIDWRSVYENMTPLTWSQLIDPKMMDHYILVIYPYPKTSEDQPTDEIMRIVGMSSIDGELALIVKSYGNEEYIVLEDGKGILWEAYEVKTI